MKINIYNETKINLDKYFEILESIFSNEKNEKSMEIIFVTPSYMKDLNNRFRKINKQTDVLSFPNDNINDTSIGDIFINLELAKKQAIEYEHDLKRELAFLAVHGYLHLLGYDHNTKEEEKLMFEKQEDILLQAGIERKK